MTCNWCSAEVDPAQNTCPRCGAAITPAKAPSHSGWAKLPGRKDMAKIQFGKSSCQIEGTYVPVADFNLAADDHVYFSHHVLLWKDPQVVLTTESQGDNPWHMLAGKSGALMKAHGPGHIAFSQDSPGELIALPLAPGARLDVRRQEQGEVTQAQSMDAHRHMFLAASAHTMYGYFPTKVWFQKAGGEPHYPAGRMMDRFEAQVPCLLLLHAAGNVFVRNIGEGRIILIKPTALVFKDASVKMDLYYEVPATKSKNTSHIWLRLWGPGRVAIQSVFEPVEGERLFDPDAGSGYSEMLIVRPKPPVRSERKGDGEIGPP
jgi:uncharacterized protein (AIM24 family)